MTFEFGWNKKRKAQALSHDRSRAITVDMSPKEIVNQPNMVHTESVINALCICVSELIATTEAEAQRIKNITAIMGGIKNGTGTANTESPSAPTQPRGAIKPSEPRPRKSE